MSLVAGLAATVLAEVIGISPKNVVLLTGLVSAAYSFALWRMSRRSLQMLALVVSVYVAIFALIFPRSAEFAFVPDLTAVAIVTWLFGGAVVVAGALGVLAPRKTRSRWARSRGSAWSTANPAADPVGGPKPECILSPRRSRT